MGKDPYVSMHATWPREMGLWFNAVVYDTGRWCDYRLSVEAILLGWCFSFGWLEVPAAEKPKGIVAILTAHPRRWLWQTNPARYVTLALTPFHEWGIGIVFGTCGAAFCVGPLRFSWVREDRRGE